MQFLCIIIGDRGIALMTGEESEDYMGECYDARSQMMDFQREIKSLTRLPWVRKYHQALLLLMTAGFTSLPTEGGGREQGQRLLRGRDRPWILGWEASLFSASWSPCSLGFPIWICCSEVSFRTGWVSGSGFRVCVLTSPKLPFSSDPKKCFWFSKLPA